MIISEDTQLLPGQFYVSVDEDDMYKTSKEHIVSFKKHTFAPSTTIATVGRGPLGRSSVLTLHDGYVHSSPTRAWYTAEARPVGDGWTTSAGHKASPAETNTHRCTNITA